MGEHWCKDCKNGKGETCKYTGAAHTTGIECPSFGLKEKESEMNQAPKTHPEGVLVIENMGTTAPTTKLDIRDQPTRTFDGGATRDSAQGKLDYEGFLNPLVLKRYAEYLNKHRVQSDGKLRDSDNWQKGVPVTEYMKSKWRHFMDTWAWHRSERGSPISDIEESLCAEMFNTMGMLFEILKISKQSTDRTAPVEGGY